MRKIISLFLSAVICVAAFAGCGKASSAADESLKKVKEKGELVLGLDDSFPPMGYRNENNEIVGFDIDVANEVCTRMGVELKLQPISWDAKEQELNSGNIDCIWNGMSVNEERKKAMNLSEPYMKNRMVLVVLKDSGYASKDDLKGKSIGVQNGSSAQEALENSDFAKTVKEIISYDTNVKGFMDLEAKGIDALCVDEVVANNFISQQNKNYLVLDDSSFVDEEYAIGFRKNDQALRDEVQKIISEMKADGKLAEISTKWFGKDVTIVK
jgi:polar amino acid transport system substrate-binding protein